MHTKLKFLAKKYRVLWITKLPLPSVIPAKAGIQTHLLFEESGFPLSREWQEKEFRNSKRVNRERLFRDGIIRSILDLIILPEDGQEEKYFFHVWGMRGVFSYDAGVLILFVWLVSFLLETVWEVYILLRFHNFALLNAQVPPVRLWRIRAIGYLP